MRCPDEQEISKESNLSINEVREMQSHLSRSNYRIENCSDSDRKFLTLTGAIMQSNRYKDFCRLCKFFQVVIKYLMS